MIPRLLPSVALVAALFCVCPQAVAAQPKEAFVRALVDFTNAVNGTYGDEGPALLAALDAMDAGLAQWDAAVAKVESGFAASIDGAAPLAAARMHGALGSVYLDRGRVDDAIGHLDAAAKLDPQFADAHLLRGVALQAAGRDDEAAAAFRAAFRTGAGPAAAYVFLASSPTADPDALKALSAAAVGDSPAGRFTVPAVTLLDEAPLMGPLFLGAHYAPAVALLSAGRLAEGVSRLRVLAARDGLTADAALKSDAAARLSAALRGNDPAAAVAHGETLVAQHPQSAEAHRLLGVAFWVASRHAESLEGLRRAVSLNPTDERSRLSIADVLFESRNAAGAEAALEDAGRALPDSGLARWKLATLQQTRGAEAASLETMRAAAAKPMLGGGSRLMAAIGRLYHRQVDLESAEGAYRRRLAFAPNSSESHFDLAEVLRAQEDLDGALVEYLAAALLDPSSARALAMAGIVQASAGRDVEAVQMLRHALARDPEHLESRYALARALLRLGHAEDGQRELALFQKLQAKAMEEERRRYRENQAKIDAVLGAGADKAPSR